MTHWTAGIHHDGSNLYVSNPTPQFDETVTIALRVPLEAPIRAIFLRTAPDGESLLTPMEIVDNDSLSAYWAVALTATMPQNHYRFKLHTTEGVYFYNALGITQSDGPDWFDFRLLADYDAPEWVLSSVFYQIFPDRFYNGDPSFTVEPGAWSQGKFKVQVREWGAPPLPYAETGNLDFYGGDLPGIAQKLDYLQDLGINALYLNPIFASTSNHRYNIDDFFNVDRYLGGSEALADLRRALDARGMRLVLDLTPNHTSSTHPWFTAAQADPHAPSADFYTFGKNRDEYASWLGVRSLPKLNYNSQHLREIMYSAPDSVMRHWLKEPYRIDGWRLDVLNMTGRQGRTQLGHKIGRAIRRAVKSENPQAYLFGEHFFDGTPNLQGNELDATMNYQGFNIPMWRWLAGYENPSHDKVFSQRLLIPSEALAEQMSLYLGTVPWLIGRQQFNQLDSHDTERILTILGGDKALLKLAVAFLMTYPGVPCIYYGDEIGLEGGKDPDNRRTMPWDESEWDHDLRRYYQQLIGLRRTAPALIHGGYQRVYAADNVFAFQRQSLEQQLIVVGHRGTAAIPDFLLPVRHAGAPDNTVLIDWLNGGEYRVQDGVIRLGELPHAATFILEAQ